MAFLDDLELEAHQRILNAGFSRDSSVGEPEPIQEVTLRLPLGLIVGKITTFRPEG
jgi:hypothetical protein